MTSLLILSSLLYPVTLLRKRISAASRRVKSLFVVTHISLPHSSDGLATTKLDQPPWKNGQHQTPETRPQLQTSRKKRSWAPQETMPTRRCRNRSNDLIHGRRCRWWWWCFILLMHVPFLSCLLNLGSSLNSMCFCRAWPISAGPTFRPTLCQRCVVRRVSGRFNFLRRELDERS